LKEVVMLEFYSSSNGVVNSKRAVAECLENALGTDSTDCDLIIFYTTIGHNFEEILSEFQRLSPSAQIVGCTGTGVIGREGPNETMRGLAIMAIRGPREEFAVASVDSIVKTDSHEVSVQLAQDLKNQNPNINMILFHPSGLEIFPEKAIEGIESVFGSDVPIFGGPSLDNMKFVGDFQFAGDRIFERGAVAVGFADSTLEVIAQSNHGFSGTGESFEVTRSELNHIFELDGQTAWKSLTERLGLPETAQPVEVAFAPLAEQLPDELHEEYGSRHIIREYGGSFGSALEDGSLFVTASCPEGTKLWLMKRDEKGIFEGVDRMVEQVAQRCEGRRPVTVFHADCGARGRLIFNRILKDEIVSRMQYPLCKDENVPWLGMYGGGEFTMTGGRNQIHAFTTSIHVMLRRDD
jgi:hypothetical protein